MQQKTKIGIVGCGNISGTYLKVARTFDILEVAACADVIPELAQAKAAEYGVPKACSPDELLADPDIEIVVNLTPPAAHADIAIRALEAGKSIYNEKPLAIAREDARRMLQLAKDRHLRVGCAPDTFMGAGLQTCRKLIDDGWIGQPVAATAFMLSHGPESWHPNPFFFYQPGAGPLFDMGPYYLTALVSLLGPVRRVTASARASFPERIATCKEHYGERIPVSTATHVAGVLDFASGAVGTLIMSFDVWAHTLPRIEIYGSEGSLAVPDPNTFGGPVLVRRAGDRDWREVPLTHNPDTGRGIGPADLAYAARSGRPHRASSDLAYHVLDLMHAFLEASESGQHIVVQSTCTRPAPLPMGLLPGTLDE